MKLSAPKNITFIIAAALGVIGLLGAVVGLGLSLNVAFWLTFVGLLVLAAGNLLPNL
jgi:hypothetical protein